MGSSLDADAKQDTNAMEDNPMGRTLWIGLIVGGLACLALGTTLRLPEAMAQKARDDAQWDYKVGVFYYNPGERMTDERRAAVFERERRPSSANAPKPHRRLIQGLITCRSACP